MDPETYVAIDEQLEAAIGPKTKAIMMAHTLGNPFNVDFVQALAKKHNLPEKIIDFISKIIWTKKINRASLHSQLLAKRS